MADSSTQSLIMQATPEAIMAVIADFAAYPDWTGAVKEVTITEPGPDPTRATRARFVMDAGLIKDTYELAYIWASDGRSVSWSLVKGQMQKSQQGSYVLSPTADGTEVTYSLTVELTIPMIGLLRRKAEKAILDTALKELRKRVEAG